MVFFWIDYLSTLALMWHTEVQSKVEANCHLYDLIAQAQLARGHWNGQEPCVLCHTDQVVLTAETVAAQILLFPSFAPTAARSKSPALIDCTEFWLLVLGFFNFVGWIFTSVCGVTTGTQRSSHSSHGE